MNGLFAVEGVTHPPTRAAWAWRTIEDVELATLGWVYWHNHQRLHGHLDDVPSAECEGRLYATQQSDQALTDSR